MTFLPVSTANLRRTNRRKLIAYGLLGAFFLYVDSTGAGGASFGVIIAALFFWRAGVAIGRLRLIEQYPEYVRALQTVGGLDSKKVAALLKRPQREVRRRLKAMEKMGVLPDLTVSFADKQRTPPARQKPARMVAVKCPGCGAPDSVMEDSHLPCRYCGTMLTPQFVRGQQSADSE